MNKCCSTCCNRINRKLAALSGNGGNGPSDGSAAAAEGVRDESTARVEEPSFVPSPGVISHLPAGNNKEQSQKPNGEEPQQPPEEKTVHQEQQMLQPPHPLIMVEPRPVPRILQPGADNSETDSADEMGINHNANAEAQASNAHINRSNGNIGQVSNPNRRL